MTDIKARAISDTESSLIVLAQAITGALAKPTENPVKALGLLVQHGLQRDLLGGLKESIDFLAKEGRIKPDYFNTSRGRATFKELLRALDESSINEERFSAMRTIFLNAATEDGPLDDTVLVLAMMRIVNELGTSEIVTLKAIWKFWRKYLDNNHVTDGNLWPDFLREHTGLTRELIDEDVKTLQKKRLLVDYSHNGSFRLTNTGGKLCDYLIDPSQTSDH
jgi:hypothetical protein